MIGFHLRSCFCVASQSHTAEARDCLCQFRVKVLRKPKKRKWDTAPRYTWKPFCPSCFSKVE